MATKDDLPPLPDCMPTVYALDQLFRQRHNDDDVIRVLIPVLRQAQLAAIAAHDANREKVLLWRWTNKLGGWNQASPSEVEGKRIGDCEYAWSYIEREGA